MEKQDVSRARLRTGAAALLIVAAAAAGMYLLGLPCPVRFALGIPCPGCGMTRAAICALRLDFAGAFRHHGMFWSLPLLAACILTGGKPFRRAALNRALLLLLAAGFLGCWIFELSVSIS